MAPVIRHLKAYRESLQTINVLSGQHTDLLYPFVRRFGLSIDYDLHVMVRNQTPQEISRRIHKAFTEVLAHEQPDLVLVQGDTTTAMAGASAAHALGIAVGHVEAGLRSGNLHSPYPEELNRRTITGLASYHFAATVGNRETLLAEGVSPETIFVTGNPVVDALQLVLEDLQPSALVADLLERTRGLRRILLTTHRRESFGEALANNLETLRLFVEAHEDVALIFPVHPNPAVVSAAQRILAEHPRIYPIAPLGYEDFIALLRHAWLIVSDSGGVQEEAPTIGRPLLILRENTERPEAIESGIARLVGSHPQKLAAMLEEAHGDGSWVEEVARIENPFGRGDSGMRIAAIVARLIQMPDVNCAQNMAYVSSR